MKTGLIVGKFAPLHVGHEHLLRIAARAADTLVVLVYDAPDCTRVPVSVRAGWMRALHPAALVLEGNNPPPRGVWNEETMQAHEKFIKNRVAPHRITHVFSGEEYGARLGRAFGAIHVRVEKITEGVPISATEIRKNALLRENFLSPAVRADVKKYDAPDFKF